jgi:O-antigen/teichoic acid export membrane protein
MISDFSRLKFLRRLAGFASLPLLSALTPFLLMPILARIVTKEVWSSVGIGQSVGAFAAIAVSFGWTLSGPAIVAQSGRNERPGLYVESLVVRSFVLALSLPVVVVVVVALTPSEGRVLGITMAVAISLSGLSATWYNIGEGRASDVAMYDMFPRMIATAASAAALVMFREVIVYPILLAIFTTAGIVMFTRRVCGDSFSLLVRDVPIRRALQRSVPAAATVTAGGAYSSSDVALVGIGASISSQSAYVSGAKTYGVSLLAVTALANAFQGWVAEVSGLRALLRMKVAIVAHSLLGCLGALLIGVYGSAATRILYGDSLQAPRGTMVCMGAAFFFVSLNTAVGRLALIPLHQNKAVLVSTLVGSAVGVPLLVVGGFVAGSQGGAFGLATSQGVVLTVQIVALVRYRGPSPASSVTG